MSRGCTRPSSPSTRRSCHKGRRCSRRSRWSRSRRVRFPASRPQSGPPSLASWRVDKEACGFPGSEQGEHRQEDGPEWDEGRRGGPGPTDVQCLLYCHGGHEGTVWDREEGGERDPERETYPARVAQRAEQRPKASVRELAPSEDE